MKNGFWMIACLAAGLSGCATEPTLGDRMIEKSAGGQEIGENWNKGRAMVEKGERLKEKGEDQVEDGKDNIKQGKKLIERGERLMKESEVQYREKYPGESIR